MTIAPTASALAALSNTPVTVAPSSRCNTADNTAAVTVASPPTMLANTVGDQTDARR